MNRQLKEKLKAEVIWTFTRSGAFQRARIYGKNANDNKKEEFRKRIKNFLFQEVFIHFFGKKVSEKELVKTIRSLINSETGNRFFRGSELRFGNAQKFVNLYLKGMWILGYIKVPPHFPIDRIMIIKLGLKINWTNMNEDQYMAIISEAKQRLLKQTKFNTVAEWEAFEYQSSYVDR